jgi:CheY-like chemotaxis protein
MGTEKRPTMQRHLRAGHPGFAKPSQRRPVRARPRRLRVLVVDRDDDRRDLACISLSVLGHLADEAWDTRQARTALAVDAFDVIIVDDQTPGFDVLEVTELLLAASRPARRRPAVIVVSADVDLSRRMALFKAGVVEVAARPLSLAPLHGLLTRISRTL